MDNNFILNNPDTIWNLPIPVFCIDIVIFTYYKWKLCVVLNQKEIDWAIKYILPGWIMKSWCTLDENFFAILDRKTWIWEIFRQQIHVFWDPWYDPRWHSVSLSYLSLIEEEEFLKNADFTKIKLIEFDELSNIEIGYNFKHKEIIDHAKFHLVRRMEFTWIAKHLMKSNFTFNSLHKLYESVFWYDIDIRNFKKKMLYGKLISETWETDKSNSKKPAMLYKFS
ncbi:MAG: hypothetical protein ACD_3C00014G0002 [uncultured bacterium (gcode 4)]|uniref:NrtR DNA-binding winged helix domain-containing protein n=1 Tax=uncultured bacterium (gcode 4) TaxID=1234023 RepID=K2G382_9BACT|nr:MAG: hypothetical protein ACD_3C00014G0002 [uncultured bacterium (gcode 4)]